MNTYVDTPSIKPSKIPASRDENGKINLVFKNKKEEIRFYKRYFVLYSVIEEKRTFKLNNSFDKNSSGQNLNQSMSIIKY